MKRNRHTYRWFPIKSYRVLMVLLLFEIILMWKVPSTISILKGSLPCLVVLIIKACQLQLTSKRFHKELSLYIVLLAISFSLLWFRLTHDTPWEYCIQGLLFFATTLGVFRYKFTGVFLFISCSIVGGLLF